MGNKKDQIPLFGEDEGRLWVNEWKDMPEFVQNDFTPFKSLVVHFENREDIEAFAKIIGQRITEATRSIWYPEAEIGRYSNKRFTDEP